MLRRLTRPSRRSKLTRPEKTPSTTRTLALEQLRKPSLTGLRKAKSGSASNRLMRLRLSKTTTIEPMRSSTPEDHTMRPLWELKND